MIVENLESGKGEVGYVLSPLRIKTKSVIIIYPNNTTLEIVSLQWKTIYEPQFDTFLTPYA